MQLHNTARLSHIRAFATPTHCPRCRDLMVAPYMSEFVEGGEIRHHWECDTCGQASSISITLTTH
jgi:transposase-like protein